MRALIALPLLFLSACSSLPDGITCTYQHGSIMCGSTGNTTQDLLAHGAEDEKPEWPSV